MEKIGKLATVLFISLFVLFGFLGSLTAMTASADINQGDPLSKLAAEPAAPLRLADGPDPAGYTFQDELEPTGPISSFIDISTNPAAITLPLSNEDEGWFDLDGELAGFDFGFYDETPVDVLRVSANGAIIVNPEIGDRVYGTDDCLSASATNRAHYLIAPWLDDWDEATIFFLREGSVDDEQIIIQWHNVVHFPASAYTQTVSFEVILYETGDIIEFRYGDTSAEASFAGGASGTVGIRAPTAADGLLQYSCNSPALIDNRAIRFQRSSITIEKDAAPDPDELQYFQFSGSSSTSSTISDTFFLQDNEVETFYLVPGAYAITETVPSGWELTDLSCTNTDAVTVTDTRVDISLQATDNITCTFENSRLGAITINKRAEPLGDQQFGFTGDLGDFSLYGNEISNTTTISDLSPTTYMVTETELAGWSLVDLSCIGDQDGGSEIEQAARQVTIDLDAGEHITCTFENVEESTIIVEKVTEPAGDLQNFVFSTTIAATPAFTLNTGLGPVSQTISGLSPNTYVITESDATADSWELTGLTCADPTNDSSVVTRTATINAAAGETVTCTFTNTKKGVVVIVKDAVPDYPQLFNFISSLPAPYPDFPLEDSQESGLSFTNTRLFTVSTGVYTVAEQMEADWNLSAITCDDPTGGSSGHPVTRTAVIDISPADHITCTFTNEAAPGQLIVQKVTSPTTDLQVFTYTMDINGTPSFTLTTGGSTPTISQTFDNIAPGLYTVTEAALPDWALTDLTCSDGDSIINTGDRAATLEIDPNESVTCTFTNTKQGRILVEKVTIPADDPAPFDFTLLDGTGPISSFLLTAGNVYTSQYLSPGSSYNITETIDSGWDLTEAACDNGDEINAIGLQPGDTVTCTFTNTKRGQIVVDKVTYPAGNDTIFDFTTSGGLLPDTFELTDEATPRRFEDIPPGAGYAITETVPGNWTLADVTCTNGSEESPWNNIDLSPGEVVTCTFTNVADPGTLIVEKVTPQGSYTQPFTFTTSSLEIPEFSLSTGGSDPISQTFVITPGIYALTETVPTGWEQTAASCSDNSEIGSVGLGPGETVTCSFTNTRLARVIVDKVTDPPADPTPFEFSLSGTTLSASFPLSDTSPAYDTDFVQPGLFSVTETPEFGWDASAACTGGHAPDDIDLTLGGVVTCVFTNVAQPGSITVTKRAFPSDETLFRFSITRQPESSIITDSLYLTDGDSQNFPDLTYGTYRIFEVATGGHTFLGVACDDPTGDTDDSDDTFGQVDVELAPGEEITCVFTNTQLANVGSITITKDAQDNITQPFTFTGDLGEFTLYGGDSHTEPYWTAGTYVITESAVEGWNLTNLICTGDTDNGSTINEAERQVTIDLDAGEDVECTFVNQEAGEGGSVYLPIILKSFVAQPDLVVTSFAVDPSPPGAGVDVEVTIVVENQGNASTGEGFWVDFYIDPQDVPNESNQRWDETQTNGGEGIAWAVEDALAPGESVTLSSVDGLGDFDPSDDHTIWDGQFDAEPQALYVYVDSFSQNGSPNGGILESNESNNRRDLIFGSSVRDSTVAEPSRPSELPDLPPRWTP